jgi:hypothetical protein
MALAQEWEREARRKHGSGPRPLPKALVRVGSSHAATGFSQHDVALIMKISERAVRNIERRAIDKLRRNPALRELWREWSLSEIEEGSGIQWRLSPSEIAALHGLAQTSAERRVVRKVMALIGSTTNSEKALP